MADEIITITELVAQSLQCHWLDHHHVRDFFFFGGVFIEREV